MNHIYRRLTRGKGDAIMCRAGIVENIRRRPECGHYVQFNNDVIDIFSDMPVDLLPFIDGVTDPNNQIADLHPCKIHDLSMPCINYEMQCIGNGRPIVLSRQEVFANVIGVPFKSSYEVNFTDEEEAFAEAFLYGMKNPIGMHTKSVSEARSYPYVKTLYKELKKLSDVVYFDPFDEYRGKEIRRFIGLDYRKMWCVISHLSLMVAVDSFLLHCAGSTGVPLYGIFGSTDPACRLKYDTISLINPKYSKCKRAYCWYSPCKFNFCMYSLSAKSISNQIQKANVLPIQKQRVKKKDVAIVRIRGIGDVILTLPSVKGLYDLGYSITYITSSACSSLLRYADYIKEVIPCNYNHLSSGIPELPKIDFPYGKYNVINLMNRVDFLPEADSIERIKLFARYIGAPPVENWAFDIPDNFGEIDSIEPYSYIALQFYSHGKSRIYPEALQNRLIKLLSDKGYKLILLDDQVREYPDYDNVINLTGKVKFDEFVWVINHSELFVGVDSAGIHIAGLLRKPALGLFGSVDPKLRISHYPYVKGLINLDTKCAPCNDWGKRVCSKDEELICMHNLRPEYLLEEIEDAYITDSSSIRI